MKQVKERAAQPFHNRAATERPLCPSANISGYSSLAHNLKLAISTAGISIGVALLFVAAAGVDGTAVSTKQITELCVLGLLSAFGGMWGLKMEGVMDR